MKKLVLSMLVLVGVTTTGLAQNNDAVKITKNDNLSLDQAKNEFKIFAKEEVDVNLKFTLPKDEIYQLYILDNENNLVQSKLYNKEGENKISFIMDENEHYTIKLVSWKPQNLAVNVTLRQ